MDRAPDDPLRASLAEQLRRMRGAATFPDALLDLTRETIELAGREITVMRPRDWDELRHQEGSAGRGAPYWALVWPSGMALAEQVAARDLSGRRVLELGCGLGLPSLVAASRGGSLLATDGAPDAVVFCAHNLALNDLEGNVAVVDWEDPDALADGGPWDLVLAADVLYTRQNVESLLGLLPRVLARDGEALVADPARAGGRDFLAAARRIFHLEAQHEEGEERVRVHSLRPRRR